MAPVVRVRTKKHRCGVKSFFDSLERDAQRQDDSNRKHIEEHDAMQKLSEFLAVQDKGLRSTRSRSQGAASGSKQVAAVHKPVVSRIRSAPALSGWWQKVAEHRTKVQSCKQVIKQWFVMFNKLVAVPSCNRSAVGRPNNRATATYSTEF
eukprot:14506-Heterococcus_DN1.PRE.2